MLLLRDYIDVFYFSSLIIFRDCKWLDRITANPIGSVMKIIQIDLIHGDQNLTSWSDQWSINFLNFFKTFLNVDLLSPFFLLQYALFYDIQICFDFIRRYAECQSFLRQICFVLFRSMHSWITCNYKNNSFKIYNYFCIIF